MTTAFFQPRLALLAVVASWPLALAATAPLQLAAADIPHTPAVTKSPYGQMPDGTPVDVYTLTNSHALEVKVMTHGATILSVKTPDRDGQLANITLLLDSHEDYLRGHPLFGSVVGRFANRIGGAKISIDDVEYPLTPNAGQNHIHGGRDGFHKKVWDAKPSPRDGAAAVEMMLVSPDGDEGFPGTLKVAVRYELSDENELTMDYTATTDKPTVVNLTNHAYWNLSGAGSGDVLGHRLTLYANAYLPTDDQKVPTGEIRNVKDTVMDFTKPHAMGARIEQVEGQNYDHCYVLNKRPNESLALAAHVVDPASGRVMDVWTTKPGVQFFTARFLSDRWQAGGRPYGPYHGFCLETQHYPDSPNKPQFPSPVLRPGETYHHVTVHKFSVQP
jgi:aldose 1-epimerase